MTVSSGCCIFETGHALQHTPPTTFLDFGESQHRPSEIVYDNMGFAQGDHTELLYCDFNIVVHASTMDHSAVEEGLVQRWIAFSPVSPWREDTCLQTSRGTLRSTLHSTSWAVRRRRCHDVGSNILEPEDTPCARAGEFNCSTLPGWNSSTPLIPVMNVRREVLQQDNARPHTARVTMDFLAQNNVTVLPWASRSPDLNPIEHLWDNLDRCVRHRQQQSQTLQQLRDALQDEWRRIPQRHLRRLIHSMPNRCQAVIDARGGNTRYWLSHCDVTDKDVLWNF